MIIIHHDTINYCKGGDKRTNSPCRATKIKHGIDILRIISILGFSRMRHISSAFRTDGFRLKSWFLIPGKFINYPCGNPFAITTTPTAIVVMDSVLRTVLERNYVFVPYLVLFARHFLLSLLLNQYKHYRCNHIGDAK